MKRRVKLATLIQWATLNVMKWQLAFTCGHVKFIDVAWKRKGLNVNSCNAPLTGDCEYCGKDKDALAVQS